MKYLLSITFALVAMSMPGQLVGASCIWCRVRSEPTIGTARSGNES